MNKGTAASAGHLDNTTEGNRGRSTVIRERRGGRNGGRGEGGVDKRGCSALDETRLNDRTSAFTRDSREKERLGGGRNWIRRFWESNVREKIRWDGMEWMRWDGMRGARRAQGANDPKPHGRKKVINLVRARPSSVCVPFRRVLL